MNETGKDAIDEEIDRAFDEIEIPSGAPFWDSEEAKIWSDGLDRAKAAILALVYKLEQSKK